MLDPMPRPLMRLLTAAWLAALPGVAFAQPGAAAPGPKADEAADRFAEARRLADEAYKADRAAHGDDDRYLVRPGLLADKKARTVLVHAAATTLADEDPVEFFLIHENSGKAYESLAISYARPSDVHDALAFIGMAPGEPIDYPDLRFWPKGERVSMTFAWKQANAAAKASAFDLVRDARTAKAMADTGLMFVGSRTLTRPDGKEVYAADELAGMSIASTFNEPTTVLDIPFQAPQGTVYGRFTPHPDRRLKGGTPLEITIKPRRAQDDPRVRDLWLSIKPPPAGRDELSLRYELLDAKNLGTAEAAEPLNDKPSLVSMFAALEKVRGKEQDPFVTFAPSDKLTLGQVKEAAELLARIDKPEGVRVEPPLEGELYYKAFLPDPARRDIQKRVFHGWELHITPVDDGMNLELTAAEDVRNQTTGKWELNVQQYPVDGPKDVAQTLNKVDARGPRDVYVFAPKDLAYGDLLEALRPALPTHNTVLVYFKDQND